MTTPVHAIPQNGRSSFAEVLSMIKFSHTVFALPFALLGALLASRAAPSWSFRPLDWLGILLCMVFARSAAMAFNRLVDRALDARNPRTATRHLPSGKLSGRSVVRFTAICSLLFVASTLLFLPRNPWPLMLSVPVLAWLLGYSYAKRFTTAAHLWLGAALALAPICAWLAIRGDLALPPILLGLAVLFWVAGFDILYACQDVEFDRQAGLHSIPSRFGVRWSLRFAALLHLVMLFFLGALAIAYPLGTVFRFGLIAIAGLVFFEHAIVKPNDLSRVNTAFFRVNAVISLGILILGVVDLWI
jgi:4-hydroxybenzoate polyprenyltransferase